MSIEFKEGVVCYADGRQWFSESTYFVSNGVRGLFTCTSENLVNSNNLQINEPREGYYIPKSELDTEEKYNRAIEVFGLFGYCFDPSKKAFPCDFDTIVKHSEGAHLYVSEHGFLRLGNLYRSGVKLTFPQLIAIGELKRKMSKQSSVSKVNRDIERTADKPADNVKKPNHYQMMDGVESIEIIARSMTNEQWKGFCLGNMLKYRIRAGKKDKLQQDIDKANFYGELYETHKDKCYA